MFVFRRLQLAAALLACLCAGSGLWDAAQILAWTRMIALEAPQVGLAAAIERTFQPGATCEFCEAIAEGRRAEREQAPAPAGRADARKVFWCLLASTAPWVGRPFTVDALRPDTAGWWPQHGPQPELRPPRGRAA